MRKINGEEKVEIKRKDYLIETALLTHGLYSISDEELVTLWDPEEKNIVWIEKGKIKIGGIEEYIPFRKRQQEVVRVSYDKLDEAIDNKMDAALTASATMLVAQREGIKLAITSGMGGIGDIEGERICPDLYAIRDLKVVLIATSPKDVVDIKKTLKWLKSENIAVYGHFKSYLNGFMVVGEEYELDGVWSGVCTKAPMLLLNPIDEEERIKDVGIVENAKSFARKAQKKGEAYHPAANKFLDMSTEGRTSRLQLIQLIKNIQWARELSKAH